MRVGSERGAGLVEADVAIGAEAEELEIDAAGALDGGFVVQRFVFEIGGVTVGRCVWRARN